MEAFKPPKSDPRFKPPRQWKNAVSVTLEPDLAQLIQNLMDVQEIATPAEAIKVACRMALGPTPLDGALTAERLKAYADTRSWMLNELQISLADIAARLHAARQLVPEYNGESHT